MAVNAGLDNTGLNNNRWSHSERQPQTVATSMYHLLL